MLLFVDHNLNAFGILNTADFNEQNPTRIILTGSSELKLRMALKFTAGMIRQIRK